MSMMSFAIIAMLLVPSRRCGRRADVARVRVFAVLLTFQEVVAKRKLYKKVEGEDEEAEGNGGWTFTIIMIMAAAMVALGLHSLVMMIFSAVQTKRYRTTGTQTKIVHVIQDSPTETTSSTTFRLEWLTVPELKTIAKLKGMATSGLKGELVEKLTKASNS